MLTLNTSGCKTEHVIGLKYFFTYFSFFFLLFFVRQKHDKRLDTYVVFCCFNDCHSCCLHMLA